jgi:hypothetical protein
MPEFHPPREWVGDLVLQAHKFGLKINMKPNLLPDRLKEYSLANMDEDLQNQEEPEELEDASLGFDPAHAESICSKCGGTVLDLGIEASDEYCPKRRWFKCASCLNLWSVIIGPPREHAPVPRHPL